MDIFDLKNFIQERQVSLGQKGLGVETLVARDARVYGIRPYNPTTEEAAAILEFNTTNRTSKLIGTDGIQAYFEGVPAAVKPMGGDALLEIAFDQKGTKRLMAKSASLFMQVI